MSGRCSPTDALNLLIPAFEPMDAAAELTQGIHHNTCPVICNGVVIKSHIAPRLLVVAHEADGRWTASIEGTFQVGGVLPTDVWEFEIDKVKTLRASASNRLPDDTQPPPQRRGPVPTHDWFSICGEIARRCIDPKTSRVRVPKKGSSLVVDMRGWCETRGWAAPARSEMSEAVRRVCAAMKRAEK